MKSLLIVLVIAFSLKSNAQTYFPPLTGSTWDTLAPSELGWCEDSIQKMYNWLESTTSKAFIVLKDGKIVLEKYFGTFTADSLHVWNSAGKTLTAYAVGIAQNEGYLNISDPTSDYLGVGWSSLSPSQEQQITILNQLTMTTGLDDGVADNYCTDPACLTYLAPPGTRWAYHNAPYTLLDSVIKQATGNNLNAWVYSRIGSKIGMSGLYVTVDYNHIFVSKPRSMARFGLLLAQNGYWNNTPVLTDVNYLNAMRTTSQPINESYGYLTWLNGQTSFMLPQTQFVFNGPLCPNAPSDMIAAEGKNAQIINVVPSQGIVLIRMGETMGTSLVGTMYNDTIWQYMNHLSCNLGISDNTEFQPIVLPNPSQEKVAIQGLTASDEVEWFTETGTQQQIIRQENSFSVTTLPKGIYFIRIRRNDQEITLRFVRN
jgi:CubicO group peptidase (beta-lactamase class C family)